MCIVLVIKEHSIRRLLRTKKCTWYTATQIRTTRLDIPLVMQRRDLLEFLITFPNKMENLLYLVSKLCIIFATFFWICFIIELFPVTWLRSRMNQEWFSNLTVLNIHKERTDRLSTIDIVNEFTDHYANRKRNFGSFRVNDVQ